MNMNTLNPVKALASLLQFCQDNHLSLSVAESVTGGRVSSALTALPGSSMIFKEGIVCYSPESKKSRLHIKNETIQEFGLVSSEITLIMAQEVRKTLKVDIGIATTGNAGPEANDSFAKVGQVFIAFSSKNKDVVIPKFYQGTRNLVQRKITQDVIRFLFYFLLELK